MCKSVELNWYSRVYIMVWNKSSAVVAAGQAYTGTLNPLTHLYSLHFVLCGAIMIMMMIIIINIIIIIT